MTLIYLASASPRRSQLLQQIRVPHSVKPVDLDETRLAAESPERYVERLAALKANEVWDGLPLSERKPVLGADTTVVLDDDIFGKPRDREEGLAMLERLSGRTHKVFTAVALRSAKGCDVRLSVSKV